VKVDVAALLMICMKFNQIDAYSKAAGKIGHMRLEEAIFLKSFGNLVLFRKTKLFKKKSLAELESYLSHKYLEFYFEKACVAYFVKRQNLTFSHKNNI